ncbi:uncharacterized protein DNG_03129 [Cephalotrichum gorgonifer]|uniref:DUF7730 domain-containing protein n=1 Tax=Cephalotrichum gorgonifer TaxID=2041049 RepID=A0AAE8MVB1_9PEZI|nr:uncharacterized protein DNG_03129 [Cephalotrichum gorgonifer]
MKMKIFGRRSKPPPPPADEGPSEPAYLGGQVLTEAIRAEAPPIATPDLEDLERTADYQQQSAFLRLPIEVRSPIYDMVFDQADLVQHVYVKNGRFTHATCITDHDAPDERQIEVEEAFPRTETSFNHPVWSRRLLSSWSNHWRCEEAAEAAGDTPTPMPFWSLLLSCKRM